jgi:hypothetical protein
MAKEEKEVLKIRVLTLAKIAGLFGVIYGLIAGILISILYSQAGKIPQLSQQLGIASQLGYSSLIVFPVMYGIGYFIAGAVTSFLYNLIAKQIGGVKITFK